MEDKIMLTMNMDRKEMMQVYAAIAGQIKDDLEKATKVYKETFKTIGDAMREGDKEKRKIEYKKHCKAYAEMEDCKKALEEWKPIIEMFFALDVKH